MLETEHMISQYGHICALPLSYISGPLLVVMTREIHSDRGESQVSVLLYFYYTHYTVSYLKRSPPPGITSPVPLSLFCWNRIPRYAAQAGLQLSVQPKVSLNPPSFRFQASTWWITEMCHHTQHPPFHPHSKAGWAECSFHSYSSTYTSRQTKVAIALAPDKNNSF